MHPLSLLAQGSTDDTGGGGGGVLQLFILLLIPFAMYLLLIRPQRRRMKEQAAMQSSIGLGDEVITNSGIYGFISAVDDSFFWLEIDDDVQIRIAKAAIQGKVDTASSDDDTDGEADEADPADDDGDDGDES